MKTKTKEKSKTETTLVAFLLDRTGSMETVKKETIGGFNGYLDELAKKPEAKSVLFHMTQFDSQSIDRVHDCVPLNRVARLTDETFQPRAWTPLYDAIGKTIREIEDKAKGRKVLFVTLTDGQLVSNGTITWRQKQVNPRQ